MDEEKKGWDELRIISSIITFLTVLGVNTYYGASAVIAFMYAASITLLTVNCVAVCQGTGHLPENYRLKRLWRYVIACLFFVIAAFYLYAALREIYLHDHFYEITGRIFARLAVGFLFALGQTIILHMVWQPPDPRLCLLYDGKVFSGWRFMNPWQRHPLNAVVLEYSLLRNKKRAGYKIDKTELLDKFNGAVWKLPPEVICEAIISHSDTAEVQDLVLRLSPIINQSCIVLAKNLNRKSASLSLGAFIQAVQPIRLALNPKK